MSLEKAFGKELAGDLRKETAEKLWEARKAPKSFDDVTNSEVLPTTETKEQFESIKKDIFGKLFKTEKFKENVSSLNDSLKYEKLSLIQSIKKEYDTKFEDILRNSPLTEEEREKYLSTESMEKMPLDDYLTLLKRLSGEAFYHVTRYGVRENTFMSTGGGHGKGMGTFLNDITPILKDGNIKDCSTTVSLSDSSRVNTFVKDEFVKEQKEAGKTIDEIADEIIERYPTDYFLDRESTHVSYGRDLHDMYGGENNYKFYFYFPVEYVLQNDFYHKTRESAIEIGNGYAQNRMGIQQQYNDFEIFNFGKGIPINAGILCITSGIKVDPENGSQYMLVDGKPVLDEDGNFKKPEKTIDSEEYWEKYFTDHPDLKPSKVMYQRYTFGSYHDHQPNSELRDWAKSKEIHTQDEEKKKEFTEYRDSKKEEIRTIFKNVITKIYEENND